MRAVRIEIPDPSLVILVGAAGAGKSTLAGRWFAPAEVLSSDAFRAIVGRGESDQSATRPAFAALHRALEARLRAGRLTVVDATNLRRDVRRGLVARACGAGLPSVAVVLAPPRAVVLARAAARTGRSVPPDVVARQLGELDRLLARGDLESEGFSAIHRLDGRDGSKPVVVRVAGGSRS
jgi:protein phosphatase